MPLPSFLIPPLHCLLMAAYLVAPLISLWLSFGSPRHRAGLIAQTALALFLGLGLCLVYAIASNSKMIPSQVLLASYGALGMLIVLRGIDRLISARLIPDDKKPALGRLILRGILVLSIVMPWAMSAVMVYRPKVAPRTTPFDLARWSFEDVTFKATDGGAVSAWWIPAPSPSSRTVLLVHGLGANKSNHLVLAKLLVPAGFNVLAIDTRAHGLSSGQFATLGLTERFDVLGAVRYLEEHHPGASEQILGLGASQGAAALLAAATEDAPTLAPYAARIDALALYATYENANTLMNSVVRDYFPGPLGLLLRGIGFPLAEIHAGAPLRSLDFSPRLGKLWPRPLLIIHGLRDEIIPLDEGRRLFRDAALPKSALWLDGTHNSIISSDDAAKAVRDFFANAKPVPLI